jgi:hypothetical protein
MDQRRQEGGQMDIVMPVAANTGFLGGPAVLANMAADSWLPRSISNPVAQATALRLSSQASADSRAHFNLQSQNSPLVQTPWQPC